VSSPSARGIPSKKKEGGKKATLRERKERHGERLEAAAEAGER
jgi:hypothetical protein